MTLVVEDGTGVQSAESYAATAFIDTYWTSRTHSPFAAIWAAGTSGHKEGAAREATTYIDANWGNYFRGVRRGYVQGLLWPRTGAVDVEGYPLPDLPSCLQAAVAELAARALTSALAPDTDSGARIKEETVGPITTAYFDPTSLSPKIYFGIVDDLLAPLLNGSQQNAPNAQWGWA